MFKRKEYEQLLKWKNTNNGKTAIIIKGARRVGKSSLALEFARNEYKSFIMIDFSDCSKEVIKVFEDSGYSSGFDDLFNKLSMLYNTVLYKRESVIIFDEVQNFPKARELIKHLVLDGRYDYIETGSLISIKKNVKNIVIPSEEQELILNPMGFDEFLNAIGDSVTYDFLKEKYEKREKLGNLLKVTNDRLRLYMLVGGMPKVVETYVNTKDYNEVAKEKNNIIKLYKEDIAKYAENNVAEATAIFENIPSFLSNHDKKIRYSNLKKNGRNSNMLDAIQWISESMVGNISYKVNEPSIIGGFNIDVSKIKCYMADTGILLALASGSEYNTNELYKKFVLGKLNINKGMITENFVSQVFKKNSHPLVFFETIDKKYGKVKKYEVDFLIRSNDEIIPIEVKSGTDKDHKSLRYLMNIYKKNIKNAIILTKGDLKIENDITYLPISMAMFI